MARHLQQSTGGNKTHTGGAGQLDSIFEKTRGTRCDQPESSLHTTPHKHCCAVNGGAGEGKRCQLRYSPFRAIVLLSATAVSTAVWTMYVEELQGTHEPAHSAHATTGPVPNAVGDDTCSRAWPTPCLLRMAVDDAQQHL